MTLDVETPDPPELNPARDAADYEDADPGGSEYRREELEAYLKDGAWERAFGEWTEHTDLTEEEFAVVSDLEMVREFDFFWDSYAQRVGYHAPGVPENWKETNLHENLDSWGSASAINASLAELGQVVSDLLKEEYLDWEDDYDAPDDLPDFG